MWANGQLNSNWREVWRKTGDHARLFSLLVVSKAEYVIPSEIFSVYRTVLV